MTFAFHDRIFHDETRRCRQFDLFGVWFDLVIVTTNVQKHERTRVKHLVFSPKSTVRHVIPSTLDASELVDPFHRQW